MQDSSVNCVFEGIIPEFVYINCGKLTPVHHGEYTMLNLNGVRPVKGGSLSTLEGRDYSAGTIEQFFKKEIGLRIQDGQTTNYVNNAKEVSVFRGSYEQGQQIIADRNQANANNLIPIGVPDFIGDYIHVAPGQNSALYVVRELLTE